VKKVFASFFIFPTGKHVFLTGACRLDSYQRFLNLVTFR
jgi:hypothetical protein